MASTGVIVGCTLGAIFLLLLVLVAGMVQFSRRPKPVEEVPIDEKEQMEDPIPEMTMTAEEDDAPMDEEALRLQTCCDVHKCGSGSCPVCDRKKPSVEFLTFEPKKTWSFSRFFPAKKGNQEKEVDEL